MNTVIVTHDQDEAWPFRQHRVNCERPGSGRQPEGGHNSPQRISWRIPGCLNILAMRTAR